MANRTFTILVAKNRPYVMKHESTTRLAGNDRFEGFCIELIERLAEVLHFNYTFVEQENGVYGTRDNVTGQWSGMLGRLIADEGVDFALTDLTITEERERAVDFTTPFMNLGISILFRRPEVPKPDILAFLLPFSYGVWVSLGVSYVGASLLLYVVGRLSHDEWQNPYPCVEEPAALENQFTLANALWFNLGAILQQGSEIAPVAYGTRAVASMWWLFALVITSSYTANLASILATKSSTELISTVKDLVDNPYDITYGAKLGGSTYTFFEKSNNSMFKKMYQHMQQHKMPSSNDEGVAKVVNENYAFLAESTTIEYETERNCNVTKVGGLLDSKGYGIAMKKNSTCRQELNLALLKLQETGVLREMAYTWWKEKHGGGACKDDDTFENEELRMANFLGLFIVLAVGSALGLVVAACDLALAVRRHLPPGESFGARFWAELRFAFSFELSEKPLQGPLSGSRDSSRGGSAGSGDQERMEEERVEKEQVELRAPSGSVRRRSSLQVAAARLQRHTSSARPS